MRLMAKGGIVPLVSMAQGGLARRTQGFEGLNYVLQARSGEELVNVAAFASEESATRFVRAMNAEFPDSPVEYQLVSLKWGSR